MSDTREAKYAEDLRLAYGRASFIADVDVPNHLARAAMAVADTEQEALRRECLDREATEQDVRARLADAENALARVRVIADEWDKRPDGCLRRMYHDVAARRVRDALDGKQ